MSFLGLMTKGFDIVCVSKKILKLLLCILIMVYLTIFLLIVGKHAKNLPVLFKIKHFDIYER